MHVVSLTGIVIVNFNAGEALARCVESVLAQGSPVRLMIADNASIDGSARQVEALFGELDNLELQFNGENLGFARAVNQAANSEFLNDAHWLLILNPDCELYPGALKTLLKALETAADCGLAGPLVVNRHGEALRGTYRRFPDPWRSLLTFSGLWRLGRFLSVFQGVEPAGPLPQKTTQAEAVSGACMLVEKSLFLNAGGLDEAYGLHCEDLDLMYRLHQQGRPCLFVPEAQVYHQQGVSSSSRPLWVHWQKHRGMQRFFSKFQARRYWFPIRWLVIAGIWSRFVITLPLVLLKQ